MTNPFSYDGNSRSRRLPSATADFASISYASGIPIAYTIPRAGGGKSFSRKEMNRLAYDSTVGTYKRVVGFCHTFNQEVCDNIGGYPKGAVLKWMKYSVSDGSELPGDSARWLTAEWTEFDTGTPALKNYKVGQIGLRSNKPYVIVRPYDGDTVDRIEDMTKEIVLETVFDVISTIESNRNDFRATGPTNENGWTFINDSDDSFFPKLNDVLSESSILFRRNASRNFSSQNVIVKNDGWLVIRCTRDTSAYSILTIGHLVKAYSDGFKCSVTSPYSTSEVVTLERQFGSASVISGMIPIAAGSIVQFSVTDSIGVSVDFEAHIVGRA